MTQELEKSWAGKVFTPEELKQWASFQRELESRSHEKANFENNWRQLVLQINANLKNDPFTDTGIAIGKRCMEMVNSLYGEKYRQLQKAVWEKGFQGGHAGAEHGLSADAVAWLDKAVEAFYRDRVIKLIMQIGVTADSDLLKQWDVLLNDVCGKSADERFAFLQCIINDPRCTEKTKNWLVKIK